jgi:glycosyltransferase involved in cell wall biosynthesis
VARDRIRVVPLAPASLFRRLDDKTVVEETMRRLIGDKRPYFLSVGKISPRRNVPMVVEAFARFRQRRGGDHRLVIVGRNGLDRPIEELITDHGLDGHCSHLDFVTDDDLLHLYNGAEAFVTAATYEANSFTVLEAQSTGAPVVIPDVPGMREITGDVAVILSRVAVEEITQAFISLADDTGLRDRLVAAGLRHAEHFSWEKTSRGVLEVLEEAGSMRATPHAPGVRR